MSYKVFLSLDSFTIRRSEVLFVKFSRFGEHWLIELIFCCGSVNSVILSYTKSSKKAFKVLKQYIYGCE